MKKIYFIVLYHALPSIGLWAQVTGNVKLQGEIDYSGVKVLFSAVSQTAQTDSTLTDTNGEYSINLTDGTYLVRFSKLGFYDSTYSQNIFVTGNLSLNTLTLLSTRYVYINSNYVQDRVWDKDHVYVLKGWVNGQKVTIMKGATILLESYNDDSLYIPIDANVDILGTKESPVEIISTNPNLGIEFKKELNATWLRTNQSVIFGPGGNITYSEFEKCYQLSNVNEIVFDYNLVNYLEIYPFNTFAEPNSSIKIRCNQIGTFRENVITQGSNVSINKFHFINNYVYGQMSSNFIIDHGISGGNPQYSNPNFRIENNFFNSKIVDMDFNMTNASGMSASIKNNTFNGDSVYFHIAALDSLTITDNIFKNLALTHTYHDSKNVVNFHHNQLTTVTNGAYSFPGLGIPIASNPQNVAIDTYLNVLADPMFSTSPLLQNTSPMIGAGTNGATIGIAVKGTCVEGFLNRSYAKDTLSISGIIYVPNEPYLGAIVTSINKASLKEYSDTTDAQGNFNIDSLPEGVYIIRAVPLHPLSEHYYPTYYPKKSTQAEALSIALSSNITDMKVYLRSTLVGVDDTDWQFGVYPNPFNDELVISNPHTAPLVVTDITGIEIWQGNASEGTINTSKWQPGMYLVKMNNSVKRFIKD
jgi:hypothetical protein